MWGLLFSSLTCSTVYKKHYPPALNDEVWRLEKIGKDGSFHKRLSKAGIFTVEDFLRVVVRDSQRLRNVRNAVYLSNPNFNYVILMYNFFIHSAADTWKWHVK